MYVPRRGSNALSRRSQVISGSTYDSQTKQWSVVVSQPSVSGAVAALLMGAPFR